MRATGPHCSDLTIYPDAMGEGGFRGGAGLVFCGSLCVSGSPRLCTPGLASAEVERSHMVTTDEKTNQPKSNNRPFVRWQLITLTQLGIVNATVLSLATAALGFGLTQSSTVSGYKLCALRGGLALLMASVGLALCCALTPIFRLCNLQENPKK